jgi:hypothetical protein
MGKCDKLCVNQLKTTAVICAPIYSTVIWRPALKVHMLSLLKMESSVCYMLHEQVVGEQLPTCYLQVTLIV